jgi:hypothetical protein
MADKTMLLEKHKQHLTRFRIPLEMLRAAHVESVNDSKARELMGVHGRPNDDFGGILFPYLSPLSGERKGARVRLDKKTEDDAKYYSEQGCRHLFFAPDSTKETLEDKSIPVVIVEAEKSALALAAYAQRAQKKLLLVAIGGCWGWKRNDGKVETPSGGMKSTSGPSPDFDLIKLENRVVAIAFDSNVTTNKKVQAARDALAREMIKRGANVLIVDVSDKNNVNGPDDLIAEFGDEAAMKMFVEAKQYKATIALLADMPETVLDGRLGELCMKFMGRFPIAYSWPALVTVASSLVPRRGDKQRLNLYTALVGAIHSGKTQAIKAAIQLLGIESPILMEVMAGSAEGLMRHMSDANGNARLFSPDELAHTLEKASIQNASFTSVLNSAFYSAKFMLLMQGKAKAEFNASLSILGGLVDDRFEDLFSRSTTSGLYDRFLFGACPGGFEFNYRPFEAERQGFEPASVGVSPDVWAEKDTWKLQPRIVEIALRVAMVCAAFDGRTLLRAIDLAPTLALAEYSQRVRKVLKPNEGENLEAKIALKILAHLDRFEGDFISKRKLLHDTGAYRYGPSTAKRALEVMAANGDIEMTTNRPFMVRKLNMNGDGE